MVDPERIWLQSHQDTTALGEDRLWCQDKVWPNGPEDHEPTEYVRADLYAALTRELSEARRNALEEAAEIAENRTRDFCREGFVLQGPSYLGQTIAAAIRKAGEEGNNG
ncbi:hypothetical protein [Sinorhizobium psoraleae]|uniref:hypothetical protein n=1 Tax=Sinorhizobium psoraleae TaxID=520838 RepID=UPI0022AFB1BB|nr:hypothetical protein [Sinorhizobium psoraleae]